MSSGRRGDRPDVWSSPRSCTCRCSSRSWHWTRRPEPSRTRDRSMLHRLAVVTSGATLLLIMAGGIVTSTGSGLAVPDWPTTFGYNMLLFPWSRMVGAVLIEHSHRLLGTAVGVLTAALAVVVWGGRCGRGLRALTATAVVLVCVQGLLGGLRVV